MKAVLLVPTYHRPYLLKEFLISYVETKSTIPCWVLVDKNDPKKEDYLGINYPEGATLILTEGRSMAAKVKEVWDRFIDMDAVMLCNDDHYLKTPGWDQKILSQVTGTNVLGTNDGWVAPRRLCGMTCFSTKVLKTVGWMFPPGIEHLFVDSAWEFLCDYAKCGNILMDIMVEHRHSFKDPDKPKDDTHNKVYKEGWDNPEKAGSAAWHFKKWMDTDAPKDAQRLRDIQPKMGIMIATPSHDGDVTMDYAVGLSDIAAFFTQQGVYFELGRVVGSSLIPHARNSLVDMFLKSRCQKLLFVDSDQGFNKEAILHLFQSNKRIIGGVTPHKRFPMNLNFEPLPEDAHFFKDLTNKSIEEYITWARAKADPKGEIEVNRSGTGFLLIDRSVFEIMKEHFREQEQRIDDFREKIKTLLPDVCIEYEDIIKGYLCHSYGYEAFDNNPEIMHDEFFKMGAAKAESLRYRGEDWFFTELAKKLKIPIYVNVNAIVSHKGTHVFHMGIGA